jgi:hypothetical protein
MATTRAAANSVTGLDPLFTGKDYNFDSRQLIWLGSLNKETNLVFSWHTSKKKTETDVVATEMIVGAAGPGADSAVYPRLIAVPMLCRRKSSNESGTVSMGPARCF